jgi:hypothetical protein
MIHIEKVHVIWIEAENAANPNNRIYGGLVVDYWQNDMRGQVKLDIPENVAMHLTLNDICVITKIGRAYLCESLKVMS